MYSHLRPPVMVDLTTPRLFLLASISACGAKLRHGHSGIAPEHHYHCLGRRKRMGIGTLSTHAPQAVYIRPPNPLGPSGKKKEHKPKLLGAVVFR